MLGRFLPDLRTHTPHGFYRLIRHPAILACLFWAAVVGFAWAADCLLVQEKVGPQPFSAFGSAIVRVGDYNLDGVSETAIGAPGSLNSTAPIPGYAYVYSGADGGLMYEFTGEAPLDRFGWAIASHSDLDGDGIADLAVGAPFADAATDTPVSLTDSGRVYLISGATGLPINIIDGATDAAYLGFSMADFDDSSTIPEPILAVGAPGDAPGSAGRTGSVRIYAGGMPLYVIPGERPGDRFGASVAAILDRPGKPRLLVGAPLADATSDAPFLVDTGAAYVMDLRGVTLWSQHGAASGDRYGASVAFLGDVDRDGRGDFAVGAPNAGDVGRVYVYSGADGSLLYERSGFVQGAEYGFSLAGIRDASGDASSDIDVGSPGFSFGPVASAGAAQVIMGSAGLQLCMPTGQAPNERFGHAVAPAGDLNGDGLEEFWVGAPGASRGLPESGAARMYSVVPGPPPGSVRLLTIDASSEANTITLDWEFPFGQCAGFDFAVYRTSIQEHQDGMTDTPIIDTCSTGGAPTVTLPIPPIFPKGTCLLYNVVPLTNDEQGSYGEGTNGVKRPPAKSPCRVFLNQIPCQ